MAIIGLAAGCSKLGKKNSLKAQISKIDYSRSSRRAALKPNNPLHIATTHWARKHEKNPADPKAALNYARNLKALGSKVKATEVLARTYQLNPGHGELASEYGRLTLSLGKVQMAEQLLKQASKAGQERDWRVLSALGTVNAKRGDHKKAQTLYLAALREQPGATSVYNNLALSYALDGRAGAAESLLKRAIAKGHDTNRVRQNLALVLGLQTKFGEARQIAQADLSSERVASDVKYHKRLVKTKKIARASRTRQKVVKTAAVRKKTTNRNIAAAQAIQPPSRKPGKPVKAVSLASAKTKTDSGKSRSAWSTQSLPWNKKPGAPKTSVRKTRLASRTTKKSPPAAKTRGNATAWSTSVSSASAAQRAPSWTSAVASARPLGADFPENE